MVMLATTATIIASQAVITGAFSLTRQAIQLGYLPRLKISHTSVAQIGQIYIAPVNWLLMVCTIGLVIGFQSSSKLAAAYGVAVTSTMLITTTLLLRGRPETLELELTGSRFVWPEPFFPDGHSLLLRQYQQNSAWGLVSPGGGRFFFFLMMIWKKGRKILAEQLNDRALAIDDFRQRIEEEQPHRVRGQAVYLATNPNRIPPALMQNLDHNKILHAEITILHIGTEDIPRVPNFEKIERKNCRRRLPYHCPSRLHGSRPD